MVHCLQNRNPTLSSRLLGKDGVWYLEFEASDFSPYALVIRKIGLYDPAAGLPYYLDAEGSKVFIGLAANGKYIAPEGVTVSFMSNDKLFTDAIGHEAASQIGFITERELLYGTGGNRFSPDMGMTSAMFITVIGRLYERSFGAITPAEACAFTDCEEGAYYDKYVDWAAEKGIICGVGGGKFAPDILITREQMALILYRLADLLNGLPHAIDLTLEYPDAASISDYAKTAVLYCQTTEIMDPIGNGFVPQGTSTRAEACGIIKKFIETFMK